MDLRHDLISGEMKLINQKAPSSRMIGNAVLELADSPPNYPQSFTTLSTGSRPTREGCHTTEIRSSEKASTAPRYPDVTKDRKHYDKVYQ